MNPRPSKKISTVNKPLAYLIVLALFVCALGTSSGGLESFLCNCIFGFFTITALGFTLEKIDKIQALPVEIKQVEDEPEPVLVKQDMQLAKLFHPAIESMIQAPPPIVLIELKEEKIISPLKQQNMSLAKLLRDRVKSSRVPSYFQVQQKQPIKFAFPCCPHDVGDEKMEDAGVEAVIFLQQLKMRNPTLLKAFQCHVKKDMLLKDEKNFSAINLSDADLKKIVNAIEFWVCVLVAMTGIRNEFYWASLTLLSEALFDVLGLLQSHARVWARVPDDFKLEVKQMLQECGVKTPIPKSQVLRCAIPFKRIAAAHEGVYLKHGGKGE